MTLTEARRQALKAAARWLVTQPPGLLYRAPGQVYATMATTLVVFAEQHTPEEARDTLRILIGACRETQLECVAEELEREFFSELNLGVAREDAA